MDRHELLAAGRLLLERAERLKAAYPDAAALRAVPVPTLGGRPVERALFWAHVSLTCLRAEMVLVQAGRAGTLAVLDDEMRHTRTALERIACPQTCCTTP